MTSTSSQSAIACIYALTVPVIMAIPNYNNYGDIKTLTPALMQRCLKFSGLVNPENTVVLQTDNPVVF